jgi:hypothetical protein
VVLGEGRHDLVHRLTEDDLLDRVHRVVPHRDRPEDRKLSPTVVHRSLTIQK